MSTHITIGEQVEVLIAQPYDWLRGVERHPIWTAGYRVTGIVGASDRDYRVDVDGPTKYRGCAPECVRRVTAQVGAA